MKPFSGYDQYYRHLIFDNSLTSQAYFFSSVRSVAPSWVEEVKGKLPVETDLFVSPPNALRLNWTSHTGGDWQAEIQKEGWRGRGPVLEGEALSFLIRSKESIPAEVLPSLTIKICEDRSTRPLRLGNILGDLPAGEWRRVFIPFSTFKPDTGIIDFGHFEKLIFAQSIDDGVSHTLFIDEIRVMPEVKMSSAALPGGLSGRGFDRHVDLTWKNAEMTGVLYYQVYRSTDGKSYVPVGIQNPGFPQFTDYTGLPHGPRWYRLTAIGFDYHESPPSAPVQVDTRSFGDDDLLEMVQEGCFRYYWQGAHPVAGMARECIPGDENLVALGASGFGILAILVAVERGFISRRAALARLKRILDFLEHADRFHGAWPHFLDGRSGRVIPWFGQFDNGGDLVETAFLIQGLLAARQFFDRASRAEQTLRQRITRLWEGVEWDWYRGDSDQNFLYWHWSPDYGFQIDHPLIGWNETMIAYLLAVASPTHGVPAELYYTGWASDSPRAVQYRQNWGKTTHGDRYTNGRSYFGVHLPVGVGSGGPLFFTHYSFLGFDPRRKRDRFANYFQNNRAIALINHAYCMNNPLHFDGYGDDAWGLTACDDHSGYLAHEASPHSDNGTLSPTGALASSPFTPEESMKALRHFYYDLGDRLWGFLGFRDAYNPTVNFVSAIFMGLNQAPITVMIENQRSGLPWRLFMANPEIQTAIKRIGFEVSE